MLVIGHRGASAAAPENTPESFELADRQGADGVELDVRLDLDGDPVRRLLVHHDPLPVDPGERAGLPTLDDVLDACGDRMLVNVEIKNSEPDGGFDPLLRVVAPTLEVLRRRGPRWTDRWLLSSFSLQTIDHCRLVAPDLSTAFLVYDADPAAIGGAVRGGHRFLHPYDGLLTGDHVADCHRAGLRVNVWTVNEPARLVELADFGVDGACTDVPDLALEALGRAGAAPVDVGRWSG